MIEFVLELNENIIVTVHDFLSDHEIGLMKNDSAESKENK